MPIITQLVPARKRSGGFSVEVDGEMLGVARERDLVQFGLSVGAEIDDATLSELRTALGRAEAMLAANQFVAHRPRTTQEVRRRLHQAGHDEAVTSATIEQLLEQGLLDDRRFADMWVENRVAFSPRSPRMLELELRRKGLDRGTIDEAIERAPEVEEAQLAVDAGRRRLRRYETHDRPAFEREIGAFLSRRGFDFSTSRRAAEMLWNELHPSE